MERDPDLALSGFRLWVLGKPYGDAEDAYARDLLDFRTSVATPWSTIKASGVLSAAGLAGFSRDLTAIYETLAGEAVLEAPDGDAILVLTLTMKPLGQVEAAVFLRLGPKQDEDHRIVWRLDQTFLESLTRQARALAIAYPSPFTAKAAEPATSAGSAKPGVVTRLLDIIFGERTGSA